MLSRNNDHNIIRNKKFIRDNNIPLKSILNDFSSKKWLLIGAGPSLDFLWPEIKGYQDNGWNMAVCDMALYSCLAAEIKPDLLFTCESAPYNFFGHLIDRSGYENLTVIASASTHPSQLIQLQNLNLASYSFFQWETDRVIIEDLPFIPPGGNVLNAMLVLLGGLPGGQIKIYGNDYSFSPRSFYAAKSANLHNHHMKRSRLENAETHYVKITRKSEKISHDLYTTPAYKAYSQWEFDYLGILKKSGHVQVHEGKSNVA